MSRPTRWLPTCVFRCILASTLSLFAISCSQRHNSVVLHSIGETVELEGWKVQVISFSLLSADDAFEPAPGYALCSVELAIENDTGGIRFMMPERQMQLYCDGTTYTLDQNASIMSARLHAWMVTEGEMRPAVNAHGAASYQIPRSAEEVQWTFHSGLLPWSPTVTFALVGAP